MFHVPRKVLWDVWDVFAVSRGAGTLTLANGTTYVGKFKDNKMHGQGTGMSCALGDDLR